MKSQVLVAAAICSVSFAARIKRPESLVQYESQIQSDHALSLAENLDSMQKAVASGTLESARQPTEKEKQEFVNIHNKYRCMHGAASVKWSDAMANDAHNYIKQMSRMKHSQSYDLDPPAGPAGENLYMASWAATPSQAVDAWYSEVNDCQNGPSSFQDGCANGAGGAVTGHFTVMVWTGVKEIGCAFSDAKAGLIICRYKAGDRLSAETPNMNKGSGNYVSHVRVRTKTEQQCGAGADSGNDDTSGGGASSDDSDSSDDSGPIDYEHCVAAQSIGQCGQCTHSSQCGSSNDGRSQFCCPFLKKCVPDSQTGCSYPIGNCRPPCHEKTSEAKCSCQNKDYPTTWLGKTCGRNSDASPTPPPATPRPTPRPAPPAADDDCNDVRSENHCIYWKGQGFCDEGNKYRGFMMRSCKKTCGVCNPAQDSTPAPTEDASTRRLKQILASFDQGLADDNGFIERLTAWKGS